MTVVIQQAKVLYGFSRGTQAILSVAQPLVGALLATDHPSPARLGLAVLAATAGFFAVFAANDLLDTRLDRRRLAHLRAHDGPDIDSAGARHPVAQGQLAFVLGLTWVLALSTVALTAAALLNWVCAMLFVAAALLEAGYCLLATVSAAKLLLSGVMVAVGACAGWFAFSDRVDPVRLGLFALWMFAWEIGGRNIPNDLSDVEEDAPVGLRTFPVVHGSRAAARLAFAFLAVAAAASCALAVVAGPSFGPAGLVGALLAAWMTLLSPGVDLVRRPEPPVALRLFNHASFQPVCVLAAFAAGHVLL